MGWSTAALRPVSAKVRSAHLIEAEVADESQLLLVVTNETAAVGEGVALAYSRRSPYALVWDRDGITLAETVRWEALPGDRPLAAVSRTQPRHALHPFELAAPSAIASGATAMSRPRGSGRRHPDLPERLAEPLAALRLATAQGAAFQGEEWESTDVPLLRLYHQLMFVRFKEDWGAPASAETVRHILQDTDPRPRLGRLLRTYSERLNSTLFEGQALSVESLPVAELTGVLRSLVEPWDELQLNFSVTRSEVAGHLYQSYMARLPASAATRQETLFPIVTPKDQRAEHPSYYTPLGLARLLAMRTVGTWLEINRPTRTADVRVLDPACGSGVFLVAAYRVLRDYFEQLYDRSLTSSERVALLQDSIFGVDVDENAVGLAQIQLLEEANPAGRLPNLSENLLVGDALAAPPGSQERAGAVNWNSVLERVGSFTCVLTNPPFGSQVSLPRRLEVENRRSLRAIYPAAAAWGADYASYFLELSTRILDAHGTVGIILPRSWLDGAASARSRVDLADDGLSVTSVTDFRGLHLFEGSSSYVAAVVFATNPAAAVDVEEVTDSRASAAFVLDALSRESGLVSRFKVPRAIVRRAADDAWTGFEFRWQALSAQIGVPTEPFAPPSGRGGRLVVQGTQPGDLARFVVPEEELTDEGEFLRVEGLLIPRRYLPRYVRAVDITPFSIADRAAKLFVPFDNFKRVADEPSVRQLLERIQGLPGHPQPGDLATLRSPKVLVRGFAIEPAAAVDTAGDRITIKGAGGGIAVRPADEDESAPALEAIEALLNAALYQWLLRGFGKPRGDETVEYRMRDVAALPWPQLSGAGWTALSNCGFGVRDSLTQADPLKRLSQYRAARLELDELVFRLLRVGSSLREVVEAELIREG